jgi:hypothetical protein
MNWIQLAQNRHQWQGPVDVTNHMSICRVGFLTVMQFKLQNSAIMRGQLFENATLETSLTFSSWPSSQDPSAGQLLDQ